jgi:hypothetical protein
VGEGAHDGTTTSPVLLVYQKGQMFAIYYRRPGASPAAPAGRRRGVPVGGEDAPIQAKKPLPEPWPTRARRAPAGPFVARAGGAARRRREQRPSSNTGQLSAQPDLRPRASGAGAGIDRVACDDARHLAIAIPNRARFVAIRPACWSRTTDCAHVWRKTEPHQRGTFAESDRSLSVDVP